ncbi:glycosyltransferase family 4 protein [Pseudomonas sp. CCI3.2]|uniref:glycosyltransferase family 4 protein n=1 Tax=unclassified Pseudomonas TaxID=196821 RepID=UPI002AC986E1|nr:MULTISPECIES: glycosyltransferase family 4 protein [unclassified Pseudomonas]MEB0075958.1 glycosyltransferase family 4 protein [Pseudomonas sp. MH10out]MEB0101403.1 glycosyltransferase family 4 protein [Pseudomonas sp. CCI3.2]MEB0130937.1 glycosyltransferase family 4 protein [Pseudomonas sp. CCI2.4]MEB0157915.1 glycosyltransferase family 4 protein [Pseudomonas sp. AH2 (2023)]MEB0166380.1 glycosyltransferase family 4 protein [Pseudomonas sp. CCC4.4]
MIKVLHFFKTYYPDTMGGIEQVIFQIAEGGTRHGFESEVLSLSHQGAASDVVVGQHLSHRSKLDFHCASTGFSVSVFKDFAALAKSADVIHYHFPWPFMDIVHFASRIKKPTVVSYHSDIIKQKTLLKLYQPLMQRFLSSVDCIVASSPNYAQSSPVLQQFNAKVRVIPYGLDRDTYPTSSVEKLDYWRKLVGSRFFLFIGALRYYKGLDYLLDAAQTTQLPVVILGGGHLEGELKAKAARLGLTNVHFVGFLPDVDKAALLELCSAFVFPSHLRSESFGISLLEGAMYGKPMISCEIGTGTTFINIAGETGLVVPPCDSAALGQAMLTLWQNPEMASTMGENALRRYEELFSADVMAESYAQVYKALLHR